MEPLHKFLIPRLDLVQGGGWFQLERIESSELQARYLALRTAWRLGLCVLIAAEGAVEFEAGERIVQTCRAFSEWPGRPVAGDGVVAEAFDFALAHALEVVPRLVMGAGMGKAEPQMLVQFLPALRNAEGAFFTAAGFRAGTHIDGRGRDMRHIRFDADV